MEIYAYTTLLILILCFLIQLKYYGVKCFLHPSILFLLIWILSVISFIIYINVGLIYIIFDQSLIEELFGYVSFTALCFILASTFSYKKLKNKPVLWTPKFDEELFKIISTVILLYSLIFFFIGSGFDIVKNREQMVGNEQWTALHAGSISYLQMISSLLFGLSLPMLILSGYFIGKTYYLRYNQKLKINIKIYYFYPFINAALNTIAAGGRAGIFSSILFLIMGILLALFKYSDVSTKIIYKFLRYGLIIFISFSVFTTYVNVLREGGEVSYARSVVRWDYYPALKPFSGLLQYLTDHYPGYQLRRVDSIPPEPRLGQTSLSGFTMFSVPVVSQLLGTPISIQAAFNLYAPNTILRGLELKKANALWTNTTGTVYILLYEDFGYWGTFIAIFIFVIITQWIFNSIFLKKRTSFLPILPFILIYYFWSQTIFSHVILGNWMSGFIYSFLIADIISSYKKVSFKRIKINV